jgi:translation initiation factor IF-2
MADKKSKSIEASAMSVADLSKKLNIPATSLILALLKRGTMAARNAILDKKIVSEMAKDYGFTVIEPVSLSKDTGETLVGLDDKVKNKTSVRTPVVVVMGHVDHGKTTLLDFVRNTQVAEKEKGGITQHVGAYSVNTSHGDLVFLDTPGHEAFTFMRERGATVADIAIVVIAADDGIKPQTIEAIECARQSGVPIIVALNKVDKASDKQIENVKSQLSQHDLLPEDWGGQTVCMLISALTGKGVDDLLEIVALQSEVLDLKTSLDVFATGYVLESHLKRGLGPVATVILRHGVLSVGDSFVCGSVKGKVNSLRDHMGKSVKKIEPSHPVQVSGFDSLPSIGDIFQVGTAKDVKKGRVVVSKVKSSLIGSSATDGALKIIVKADTASSLEALVDSVNKLSGKVYGGVKILNSGIGSVIERDVVFAGDTGSLIFSLHTKVDSNALSMSKKLGVDVRSFNIIYKLLENLEEEAESNRPVVVKSRKIGEATVLKVFDIKKLGVIAGSRVVSGKCVFDSKLKIFRNNKLIGEGSVLSLQQDKKAVKEVRKGFECAFMVKDFSDWSVGDLIECYISEPV